MKTNRIQRAIYRSHPQKTMRIFFETIFDPQSLIVDEGVAYTILWHASVSNVPDWTAFIDNFVRDTGIPKKKVTEFLYKEVLRLNS